MILTIGGFQVERVLVAEQRATDFKPQESGHIPDHQPTHACTRWVYTWHRLVTSINWIDLPWVHWTVVEDLTFCTRLDASLSGHKEFAQDYSIVADTCLAKDVMTCSWPGHTYLWTAFCLMPFMVHDKMGILQTRRPAPDLDECWYLPSWGGPYHFAPVP
jgi:hypothetical protein